MAQLSLSAFLMPAHDDMKHGVQAELCNLQELVTYLEDRAQLGARDWLYCQLRLRESLKALKRLERSLGTAWGQ